MRRRPDPLLLYGLAVALAALAAASPWPGLMRSLAWLGLGLLWGRPIEGPRAPRWWLLGGLAGLLAAAWGLLLGILPGPAWPAEPAWLLLGLGPLAEELLFRQALQLAARRRWGRVAGVVLPALGFALLHAGSSRGGLTALGGGLLLGLLRERSGSPWPGVLAHALANASLGMVAGDG